MMSVALVQPVNTVATDAEKVPPLSPESLSEVVVLHGVKWRTYESLLADLEESSGPRLAYDQGTLEIMSPLQEHEELNRTLALIVEAIAAEWDMDLRRLGSTTFRREDLQRGFEPDSCFYLQSAGKIYGKTSLDLNTDPPPDLVIEIDTTHSSLDKLPIYAAMRVPEVWRWVGGSVSILILEGGNYHPSEESLALAPLSRQVVAGLIDDSKSLRHAAWLRKVRDWAGTARGVPGD